MEVDGEIDQNFMQQFSSMGTTDRDVLIAEFQRLLGNQLNPTGCAFFLDMNNWNLQEAVCAYYDLEQPRIERIPSMAFVRDITIGEGESVPPLTNFVKSWRVQNAGNETWPPGCNLKFLHGDRMSGPERVMVESIGPGQYLDVCVNLVSPGQTGIYQSQWRMCTPTGIFFGEVIWAILCVEEAGLLGVTQQMSQIGHDFMPHASAKSNNPFVADGADALTLCYDEMTGTASPTGSPNCSIIAQHGSPLGIPGSPHGMPGSPHGPNGSPLSTLSLNDSFPPLSPIRPTQSFNPPIHQETSPPFCSSTENLNQEESMVS